METNEKNRTIRRKKYYSSVLEHFHENKKKLQMYWNTPSHREQMAPKSPVIK